MKKGWGFAALIENPVTKLLFDTGLDGDILLNNMKILGTEPNQIQGIALSQEHPDHVGGLHKFLDFEKPPILFIPSSFRERYKKKLNQTTHVIEIVPWQSLSKDIYTTGEIGSDFAEQSLVLTTGRGIVIVTGCAHTGILRIVEDVKNQFGGPICMILGGIYLPQKHVSTISSILDGFHRLGVEKVAPCHCTGDRAINMFAVEYGDDFIRTGVGKVLHV